MSEAIAQLEAQRPALTGHCYRMLGSTAEADDAVQETIIRAWRNFDHFDGRASLRTWMYRIGAAKTCHKIVCCPVWCYVSVGGDRSRFDDRGLRLSQPWLTRQAGS